MATAGDLGERKIIETIIASLDKMPKMPLPFGDDASAIDIGDGRLAVVKTDMLVGKTDVPRGMTAWQAARKAVVMNISDLASKGVKPIAILASVGVPRNFLKKDIESIGLGLNAGAREYGAYVIGGDTCETSELIICCTATGICLRRELVTRFGARPGDILAVTGTFGSTSAGLRILLNRLEAPSSLAKRLLEAVYMPKAQLRVGLALAKSGALTASIDSSDGLAVSLHQLRLMSRVGFTLTSLPIASEAAEYAKMHGLDPAELALYGGEEYELVVTINPKFLMKAKRSVSKAGGELIVIGRATKEGRVVRAVDERVEDIPFRGWEHFKSSG